jgi:hypothetical protein
MDRDLIEALVAFALIIACAWLAIATAQPPKKERASKPKRRVRPARLQVSGAAPPPAAAAAVVMPFANAGARPRIFTGETTLPATAKPATKRALKLVAGMTALAAAGAIGLLALVGAIVKMFQGIGG